MQIRDTLEEGRCAADRILGEAERRATELGGRAASTDREMAAARVLRLNRLNHDIEERQHRIESAQVTLIEAMATAAARLATVAREADFDPPPWPDDLGRIVEIRFSETREVTFRVAARADRD